MDERMAEAPMNEVHGDVPSMVEASMNRDLNPVHGGLPSMVEIELICGDSMIIMQHLAEKMCQKFDMIFLDPPYFEWKDRTLRHGDAKIAQSGIKPNHDELSKLTFQLIKPCGAIWLCGTQPQLPFAGSGTTLIACKELNRRCLGIEINRQYCRMIKDRMRKVRLDMFL
jgi:DNA modification methylase